MMRKIKFTVVLGVFIALCACGYDYDWVVDTEYEGTTKIIEKPSYDSQPSIVVSPQSGRIEFKTYGTLKLGDLTPIPDCTISFSGGDIDSAHKLSGFDRAFKGDTNSGEGCEALLSTGVKTKIEFFNTEVTRSDNGEITVNLKFRPRGSVGDTLYEFEFQGRKKGWF